MSDFEKLRTPYLLRSFDTKKMKTSEIMHSGISLRRIHHNAEAYAGNEWFPD